jgi:Flp pilus assembly pilin Flp
VALPCHWRCRLRILESLDQRIVGESINCATVVLTLGAQPKEVRKEEPVAKRLQQLWNDERGQDIAEYAVMLAVILVIVVGTIRLIGSNANNVFSQVGSAIQ